jgi:hypothetical protein
VGDLPGRPIYIYKDIRHSSIEITIHRRCIPMWKARWTLNPQQSERGEDLSGTEFNASPRMHRSDYLFPSSIVFYHLGRISSS